ncbi:MAG: hypothetical protein Q9174_006980, partial [Haloplaca sp. 1 TL-2023]
MSSPTPKIEPPTSPQPPESKPSSANDNTDDQLPALDPSSLDPDNEIDMNIDPSPYDSTTVPAVDGPADFPPADGQEARLPMQKDITLQEFLSKMDDYAPI